MATKPTKPSRQDDMRKKPNKRQYGTADNRDKVVPHEMPYPDSIKPKKEEKVDFNKNDNHRE